MKVIRTKTIIFMVGNLYDFLFKEAANYQYFLSSYEIVIFEVQPHKRSAHSFSKFFVVSGTAKTEDSGIADDLGNEGESMPLPPAQRQQNRLVKEHFQFTLSFLNMREGRKYCTETCSNELASVRKPVLTVTGE